MLTVHGTPLSNSLLEFDALELALDALSIREGTEPQDTLAYLVRNNPFPDELATLDGPDLVEYQWRFIFDFGRGEETIDVVAHLSLEGHNWVDDGWEVYTSNNEEMARIQL